MKDLLGGTIKEMMEAEMGYHLGYEKSARSDSDNARNGYKSKRVNSSYGNFSVEVPQDRNSTFEPQIVPKRKKDISTIDQKIISMYARGLSTRQISDTIEELYGFEVSDSFVSDVTDKILPQIQEWQSRPLEAVYPVVFIDGHKEVLNIEIGENESAKYWLVFFYSLFLKLNFSVALL